MGTVLLKEIVNKYYGPDVCKRLFLKPCRASFCNRIQRQVTGPTVILVRDLFAATVSGYLYHKTGRECWLNRFGKPNNESGRTKTEWMMRLDWRKEIRTVPYPEKAAELSNLCQVLADVDETVGLGVADRAAVGAHRELARAILDAILL